MNRFNRVTGHKPATMRINNWRNMRVWIIGASSGIGQAVAKALLEQGAYVYVSARSHDKLQAFAQQYERATALALDATDSHAVEQAYQTITAQGDSLDVFLHAAARYEPMRTWEINAEKIDRTMTTNYHSVVIGIQTILADMQAKQSGHIAVIASVAGYMGMPNALAYGPTKAALINLCESLYVDLHDKGIAVHLINPGFVKSALTDKNNFDMPAIISAERAADYILHGFAQGKFEITFPKRFTYSLKFVQMLPYSAKLWLLKYIGNKPS